MSKDRYNNSPRSSFRLYNTPLVYKMIESITTHKNGSLNDDPERVFSPAPAGRAVIRDSLTINWIYCRVFSAQIQD